MLAATLTVVQVMDILEIRCTIREVYEDVEDVWWHAAPVSLVLSDETMSSDPLTIILAAIGLWSEITISR